jgi:hypothetical protein
MEQVFAILYFKGRDSYINFDNGGNYKGFTQIGKEKFERGSY